MPQAHIVIGNEADGEPAQEPPLPDAGDSEKFVDAPKAPPPDLAPKMVPGRAFMIMAGVAQVVFLILFGILAEPAASFYEDPAKDAQLYNLYLAVTVMMFVGFGYLMTFMSLYGLGAVGLTMFVTCLGMQVVILFEPLFATGWSDPIHVSIVSLIGGSFGVATFLISFGGLIGKINPAQLVVLVLLETVFYCANTQVLLVKWLEIVDVGGSIAIHMFGAYFGLAAAKVLGKPSNLDGMNPTLTSNIFSLIGTTFLWIYWPSFVSALVDPGSLESDLAITNTVLALVGSTVTTFILSAAFANRFLRPVDIQNATLAGGVSIGAVANLNIHPWGALFIGCIAGAVSTVGYNKVQGFLEDKLGLHDTCGIHNLHGMPSVVGGVASIFVPLIAKQGDAAAFGDPLHQALGIVVTLIVAILTGAITGVVMRLLKDTADFVSDELYWEVSPDYLAKEV